MFVLLLLVGSCCFLCCYWMVADVWNAAIGCQLMFVMLLLADMDIWQDAREPGAERVRGGAGQSPETFCKHYPGNY